MMPASVWSSKVGKALVLLLLLTGLASLFLGGRNATRPGRGEDFQWPAVRRLAQRIDPYAAYLETGATQQIAEGDGRRFFPNYPITGYVVLLPLGFLDWPAAKVCWALVNILSALTIAGCATLLIRKERPGISPWLIALLAGLLLAAAPTRDIISCGQHSLFALAFFLLAVLTSKSGRAIPAGILLAVSLLKFTITVPLAIWFIYRRKWLSLAVGAACQVTALVVAWAITGNSPPVLLEEYLQIAGVTLETPGIRPDVFDFQSLARILFPDQTWLNPLAPLILIGLATLFLYRLKTPGDLAVLSVLALPASLAFFHLRYDQVSLVLPLAFLLAHGTGRWVALGTPVCLMVAGNWFAVRLAERFTDGGAILLTISGAVAAVTWASWALFYWNLPRMHPPTSQQGASDTAPESKTRRGLAAS